MLQLASSAAELPSGMYLFGATPAAAARSSIELQFDLQQLLTRLRA